MTDPNKCPVCHQIEMCVFIEIKDLPVHCNLLWSSREAALNAPRGDIRLGFCQTCGMTYNLSFDSTRMQYTEAYETSLHFSPQFRTYAQELATRLIEKYHLRGKDIIEIGCGKGEFLSLLCEGGRNRGVGFDASYDGRSKGGRASKHLTFIRDFYSEAYAKYKADLICCRQVLEHIESPREFLSQIRRAIGDRLQAVVFFEVPNILYTLRDLGIWDIIYEHCSYFSAESLTRVFTESGFELLQLDEAYGGQFLCAEAVPTDDPPPLKTDRPQRLSELSSLVSSFSESYQKKLETWKNNLRQLDETGRRTVVWGAGSKGVTFLNTLKVTDQIEYVVDVNPRKQGKFVAGSGHRIVQPAFLRDYEPDSVLLMNPLYRNEVARLMSDLCINPKLIAV